jgi:hypothetical protein
MKTHLTMPLAVAAALGAGLYATALLSDTAEANPRSATVINFPSIVLAPREDVIPAPRECKPDENIVTGCTYN